MVMRRRADLRRLRRTGPRGAAIADAVRSARREPPGEPEREWIARLDEVRAGLASSSEVLHTPGSVYNGDPSYSEPDPYPVAELYAGATKPRPWTLLLLELIRALRPGSCLELGTCLGVSAAYQAAALTLNDHGALVTIELAEARADHARELLQRLGLDRGRVVTGPFDDVLPGVLEASAPVDFVFVDGHHDEQAVARYVAEIRPYLADGAVVLVDDIRWSTGMYAAWSALRSSDQARAAVDLDEIGLLVYAGPPARTSA